MENQIKNDGKKVVIYSTSTCHWCHKAKEYFDSKAVKYEDINVSLNPQRAGEIQEISGQMGVPVIVIDGQVVIGFNQKKIDGLLNLNA
jgi:glutaredoxin-like YruB-family protein